MIRADTHGGAAAKGTQPALATSASNPAPLPLAAVDPRHLYLKDPSFGGRCSLLSAFRSRRERKTPGSLTASGRFCVAAGEGFDASRLAAFGCSPPTLGFEARCQVNLESQIR